MEQFRTKRADDVLLPQAEKGAARKSVGDSISDFMRAMGRADRVLVFLGEKYPRSPFWMFELFEVWNFSRRDDDGFRRRARLFVMDDAKLWKPTVSEDRNSENWRTKH